MVKSPDAFRTISEVADWLGIQAHVLRFWESKFTQVKPIKRAGGRRYYRPADMLLLGGIKKLLHDDGLTIKGVQKILREEGMTHVSSLSAPLDELDFLEPRSAPKPDIIRPETGVVLSFGSTKAEAPDAAGSDKQTAEAKSADNTPAASPVPTPQSAPQVTPAEPTPPSPVPPADDHPRATPDPLAPSDSTTPDAPQLDPTVGPEVEETPADPETQAAANASLPDFLKRPLASEPEAPTDVEPVSPADEAPTEPGIEEFDDTPRPAIIDLPDFTPEAEFPARPGLLSVASRVHYLPRDVQPLVAGLLLDLAELRARMAAEPGFESNY
ncbi:MULTISPECIES: MerR family transcriptional regulator [Sulfitobacter]|uniref:HTH merR-type domain-containing protein n=1 Tax=Sulfitobacter dubius TaxID=218673 RepID=A0ABY3ZMH4_9RHOB|nr:MerR family transcriptional regulator [Sulfitobacter dubius]UOA14954.1 hypothetical protein DSM109990_01772 [Sulfitobacter dubius]WOI29601.1 MerR family transcriptional regulator [Sulfitobacter dubius]